jgi:hypothetical protein
MHWIRGSALTLGMMAALLAPLVARAQTPDATPVMPPPLDTARTTTTIDNPYFPLVPRTTFVYDGTADGDAEHEEVTVLAETKKIMGAPCVVVRDVVTVDGELTEDTHDWYVQDSDGNVWYMGEDSKSYEGGKVTSTDGSWEAGVDGALPGIVMPAISILNQSYAQEYYPGEAEDMAKAIDLNATASVAYGSFDHVLVTEEWSPLEPDVIEHKSYAAGIGLIKAESIQGEDEQQELTSMKINGGTPVAPGQ